MTEPVADLGVVAARFGAALHAAGVPVEPAHCARFTRAILLGRPIVLSQLYWCAKATLIANRADEAVLRRTFDLVFGGLVDVGARGPAGSPPSWPERRSARPTGHAKPAGPASSAVATGPARSAAADV